MRIVTRSLWQLIDRVRDQTAWMLDRTSKVLYGLEERIREERTLEDRRAGG